MDGPVGIVGGQLYAVTEEDRRRAVLAHVLGLMTGAVGPLVLHLRRHDRSPFVRHQIVEVVNFQLTLLAAYTVGALLALVQVGLLILPAVVVVHGVYAVTGAVQANRGLAYRYPVSARVVGRVEGPPGQ